MVFLSNERRTNQYNSDSAPTAIYISKIKYGFKHLKTMTALNQTILIFIRSLNLNFLVRGLSCDRTIN